MFKIIKRTQEAIFLNMNRFYSAWINAYYSKNTGLFSKTDEPNSWIIN